MIEIKTKLRRWGNSFGVVVPLNKINSENFGEGEVVKVFLTKEKNDLKNVFGVLKDWKIDSQKFKDKIRKEESDDLFS